MGIRIIIWQLKIGKRRGKIFIEKNLGTEELVYQKLVMDMEL